MSCFLIKASLYFFRKSMMGVMFTSLKVVSIAVSFFTDTSLAASFLRKGLMLIFLLSRLPVQEFENC